MKHLIFPVLLTIVLLPSCNLDPGYAMYSDLVIPIEERSVPETGVVNQPVNIYVIAAAYNGCWSNIHFYLTQKDDRLYEIWAAADFESAEQCPEVIISADTVLTFTPSRTGDHVISFRMTPEISEKDTVVIGTASGSR